MDTSRVEQKEVETLSSLKYPPTTTNLYQERKAELSSQDTAPVCAPHL